MNRKLIGRELKVMFSFKAQPLWFRITKWVVFVGAAAWFRRTYPRATFWRWLAGIPLAGLTMHLVYRRKTHGWTQPWAGWNDIAAAQE